MDVGADAGDDEGRLAKINWRLQTFKLADLTDYYKNPRSLSEKEFKQLKTSLDKFGMIDKPIVNADSAHTIIGGHQRKHVLEASGVKEIECWIPDRELSDKEVEELNIRLNKNTGSWDFDVLANEFELDDLLDWGFDKGELDLDLWADDAPEDVEPQIDKAEELRVKWGVESGQLWQLGEHRLICGDCTDKAVVERVMGGEKAEMVWTDPPYGLGGYAGRSGKLQKVIGDDASSETIVEFFSIGIAAQVYVCCEWKTYPYLLEARGEPRSLIVWAKQVFGMGRGYRRQHEFIGFYGEFDSTTESDLWCIDRGNGYVHPTEKPVELPERAIKNSTKTDDIVFDPFAGTAPSLIACERLGRKCRAVEISPAYVAVAIQRWVDVTGKEPVLLGS